MQPTSLSPMDLLAPTRRIMLCAECGGILTDPDDGSAGVCAHCMPPPLPPPLLDRGAAALELVEILDEPGEYLCFDDGWSVMALPLTRERTRIGRSLTADVRFEDPTVSRRHALIVRGADGPRVFDDGSLNGVFLNGLRVQSGRLTHGDEIRVGRHRLLYGERSREAVSSEFRGTAAAALGPAG